MEVIYVDTLFLINLAINYFILLATARVCALPPKRLRLALGAAAGAAYAVVTVVSGVGGFAGAPLKLAFAAVMLLIAFGPIRRFLRAAVVFLAVSAGFGGAVYAASMLGGISSAGGLLISVSPRVLVLSFAISYAAVSLVFRRTGKRPDRLVSDVVLHVGSRKAEFSAMLDTGNALFDPISGLPVIVAESGAVLPLFDAETASCIALARDEPATETFEKLSKINGSRLFRLLPYSAVGVEMSLLLAFRPDKAEINGRVRDGLVVAISPNTVSEDGTYSALIGGELG